MNTPTIEQIHQHYSVRAYKPDPVSDEMIETIVVAGQRASTSSNLQTYSVIVVKNQKKRERLKALCGGHKHIAQAPVFMAWCADQSRLARASQHRGYQAVNDYVESFLVAAVDCALAMQNAALAAESLGLGMCYIGAIRNHPEEIIRLLELPPLVFPISGMTLGWPDAEPFIRPRLPLRAVLHWECYDTQDEEQALLEYDLAMVETGIYKGRQVPMPGRAGEIEDYGWQEHSARRASTPIRTGLREIIEKQGFRLK
jgi:FMN reductase (NADPH)